ncbi:MAG: hypothetical protein IJ223_04875 [Clostridia bacterium]|nr:hypothetical protein [Clostridia bacterium]
MIYVTIDDFVGNAFVSYLQQTGKRELTLSQIEKYGDKAVKELIKKGIHVNTILSRDLTRIFFYEYSNFFMYYEDEGIVILKDSISVDDLIKEFSGVINVNLLKELRNQENINCLL